jgi:molecular chaperone GrpE
MRIPIDNAENRAPECEALSPSNQDSVPETAGESDASGAVSEESPSSVAEPEVNRTEGASVASELEELQQQLAQMIENWQRERASFQNYKRRVEEEKREMRKYALFDTALELIKILDYFESSVSFAENLPKDAQSVIVGVKYTIAELNRVLAANGVHPVEVEPGRQYDPVSMEAIGRRETDEVAAGSVLEVARRGWLYHDRILRPAQVIVAAAREDGEDDPGNERGDDGSQESRGETQD